MERRLLILLIGLFLVIDMLAILFIYNHNAIDKENNVKRASIIGYGATSFTDSGSEATSNSLSSSTSKVSSSSGYSYRGEYVNFGSASCGCGN